MSCASWYYAYWPEEPRTMVTSPHNFTALLRKVERDNLFAPSIIEAAMRDGRLPNIHGWTIRRDNSVSPSFGATDDAQHYFYFLAGPEGVAHSMRSYGVETFRNQQYFRTDISGLVEYGAKIVNPIFIRQVKTAITS